MVQLFKKNIYKKEKSLDTKLIQFLCIFLIALLLCSSYIYFYFLQNIYSEQLEKSNDNLVEQVAISFETMMKHITDSIYKIPLYDNELASLIQSYSNDSQYKQKLFRHMDSIILGNQYLSSSYLYFPEEDIVFNSNSGTLCKLEEFTDKAVFDNTKEGIIYMVDPHLVDTLQEKKLLISIVSPIPISSLGYKGILVVNIDATRLYFDILKKIKAEQNMNFYIYNNANTILINKNESLLFSTINPPQKNGHNKLNFFISGKNDKITSVYFSRSLKWNFVLETKIKTPFTFISKLYTYIACIIVITLLGLIILIFIVKKSTKPMKKIISSYNDKLLRDFLIDPTVDISEVEKQLFYDIQTKNEDYFMTISIQNTNTDVKQVCKLFDEIKNILITNYSSLKIRFTSVDRSHVAVIITFSKDFTVQNCEDQLMNIANFIYSSLSPAFQHETYMGTSLIKDNIALIPIAYRECLESLNYKIASKSHIIQYTSIKDRKLTYEYPYDIEKQLINNIVVGNWENCGLFIEKFFGKLSDSILGLQDSEIKNIIYQLQTSILKSVSSLPLSINIDSSTNILNLMSLELIQNNVSNLIEKLIAEINKKKETEEIDIANKIFDYIEENFKDEGFNLNIAADELNINRNYLSKIVKEKINETFNDYISKKRIEMAKQLLKNRTYTVDDIAHKVGFNYCHYFIKVFKNLEGITPGQYRDKLLN